MNGPVPAVGHMPFEGHRTVAQWAKDSRHKLPQEMTDEQRERDAIEGSRQLKHAIDRATYVPVGGRGSGAAYTSK